MSKIHLSISIFVFSLSLTALAQTATPTSPSAATANMCVERGLKCCNKARGKRAEKIRTKCEKKYKCVCPPSNNTSKN